MTPRYQATNQQQLYSSVKLSRITFLQKQLPELLEAQLQAKLLRVRLNTIIPQHTN